MRKIDSKKMSERATAPVFAQAEQATMSETSSQEFLFEEFGTITPPAPGSPPWGSENYDSDFFRDCSWGGMYLPDLPAEPASPLTTTGIPAEAGGEIVAQQPPEPPAPVDEALPTAGEGEGSKELPSNGESASSNDSGAGEAGVESLGAGDAPSHPATTGGPTPTTGGEDPYAALNRFFNLSDPEFEVSADESGEPSTNWAQTLDIALGAGDADPDQTLVTVGEGDNDTSGLTLTGNNEGAGDNILSYIEDGYQVTVYANGTKKFTPVARPEPGSVSPDELRRPPGTAVRVTRKRSRKERQEVETVDDHDEVEVIEVAPKRPRVQAPPLMPTDKFCLIFPQPAGYDWDEYRGVKIESAEFFQQLLPVDSVEEAERMVKWWRQEWEDKGSNLTFLMSLPWKTDPSSSAKRLIRYAQPLCDRMREELGSEYYDRLMDPDNKKYYGHIYYRMCMDVQQLTKEKWRREEEAAAKAREPVGAAAAKQSRKRKAPNNDNGEVDAPAPPARKKQKKKKAKAKAPPRRLCDDGKIIRERGRMRGFEGSLYTTEEEYDAMHALQMSLLGRHSTP
ncbi:hypothetical protein TWF730_007388 [Orbilia blumenaviensis]|uniref:Uncharacterized protein n=1 Tax=Orbilia blumenaviensis TaxID=1796055 RepID=A0AAV9VAD5_9PEZI